MRVSCDGELWLWDIGRDGSEGEVLIPFDSVDDLATALVVGASAMDKDGACPAYGTAS
jgi:hypothetical protein